MVNIRFSNALHYLTSDNVKPEMLNADALRGFLRHAIDLFRIVEKTLAKEIPHCQDKEASKRLTTLRHLSRFGHERFKNCLPHLQSDQKLFWCAQEAEGILRYITTTACEQLPYVSEPFRTCLQDELSEAEDRLSNECERALNKMKLVTH